MWNADQPPGGDDDRTACPSPCDSAFLQDARIDPYSDRVALLLSDELGFVCYADVQCERLTGGLRRGEIWTHIIAREDRDRVYAAWTDNLLMRVPFTADFRVRSAQERWVRACGVFGSDLFDDGTPGWTWHFMDCTSQYRS